MKTNKLTTTLLAVILTISFLACDKEEDPPSSNTTTWTITIEAFTLDSGVYTPSGNELIFDSEETCQTWSRTAQNDSHGTDSHLHYNAATDVSFDNNTISFSWTEYGPELDQATIETTCSTGVNGTSKTVNDSSYYQDKPNVYLKITSVVEN